MIKGCDERPGVIGEAFIADSVSDWGVGFKVGGGPAQTSQRANPGTALPYALP